MYTCTRAAMRRAIRLPTASARARSAPFASVMRQVPVGNSWFGVTASPKLVFRGPSHGERARAFATAAAGVDASTLERAIADAKQFCEWDPNPTTRAEAEALLEAAESGGASEQSTLVDAFGPRLLFGTAGIRGVMGAGTSRMNDVTVIQAAQGLCAYLGQQFGDDAPSRGVVVGYDHRGTDSLSSRTFAMYTAAAFLSRGFTVYLYQDLVATPLVPFAVDRLGCVAGVMVTASHNPRQDNGFKVYWDNGAQIISPHDTGIATCISENTAPWEAYDVDSVTSHPNCHIPDLGDEYLSTIESRLCRHKDANSAVELPIVYTAMHGVGYPWIQRVFEAFNLAPPIPVAAQVTPDPTFPTVSLPNPEEGKGALALATKTADEVGANLILASDPDADRLAVAERNKDGSWHLFNGNDIGALLGHWQWEKFTEANARTPPAEQVAASDVYMMAPAVASKMLAAMAKHHGFNFEETLTGFKWAGNKAHALRGEGKTVLFAYEPEIGFCVGDVVKDKDGISAAAVFAEMAQHVAQQGKSLQEHFWDLKDTYGHFVNKNSYLICHEQATLDKIFGRLRNDGHYWLRLGRFRVTGVRDLTVGVDTATEDGVPHLPVSASSHYLTYTFDNGAVLTFRTSGTEPKLKYYSELHGFDPEATKAELLELVELAVEHMLQPEVNGLAFPKEE